jgi:hypothetical protein
MRLQLQVKQLKERFSSASSGGTKTPADLLLQWCAHPGVAGGERSSAPRPRVRGDREKRLAARESPVRFLSLAKELVHVIHPFPSLSGRRVIGHRSRHAMPAAAQAAAGERSSESRDAGE